MTLGQHRRSLQYCSWCPKLCRFCCPTAQAEKRETVTPWGKMTLAEMLREGRISPEPESAEALAHCLSCLHCRTHCRHGIDVPTTLVEARALFWKEGGAPEPLERLVAVLSEWSNPFGKDLRPDFEREVDPQTLVEGAQAALFTGCRLLGQEGKLRLLGRTLQALGVDYLATHSGQLCCGWVWYQTGESGEFLRHARRLAGQLSRYRLLVCPCPACAHALRNLYPALGVNIGAQVLHLSEFLAPLLERQKPPRPLEGDFVYHDPCLLARHLEQTEAPRRLLARLLALPPRQVIWSGADTFCCGGGGLVPFILPQVARESARLRLEQLLAPGRRLVTACPGCVDLLSGAAEGVQVHDLFELAARALGVE